MIQVRLTDAQCVILAEAAKRDDGSLLPFPKLDLDVSKRANVVSSLERRGFVEPFEVKDDSKKWRDRDDLRFGLRITEKGLAAIGIESDADGVAAMDEEKSGASPPSYQPPAHTTASAKPSKQSLLVDMLGREDGASLDEMVAATGWLSHTARAMLTGLKKKGHMLSSEKVEGVRRYRTTTSGAPK